MCRLPCGIQPAEAGWCNLERHMTWLMVDDSVVPMDWLKIGKSTGNDGFSMFSQWSMALSGKFPLNQSTEWEYEVCLVHKEGLRGEETPSWGRQKRLARGLIRFYTSVFHWNVGMAGPSPRIAWSWIIGKPSRNPLYFKPKTSKKHGFYRCSWESQPGAQGPGL